MRMAILFFFSILVATLLNGQMVETAAQHPKIADGIFVDASGNVFTTPGGLVWGTEIGKVAPDGSYTAFATGFNGPIDIEMDNAGVFYVTNYDNNTVKAYDSNTGELSILASGLDGPAGIARRDDGSLYISNFGAPQAYNGKTINRIMPDGTEELFLENSQFVRPQGIAFADDGYFYLADSEGRIYKIDPDLATLEVLAELGVNLGNMAFGRGKLYVTAIQAHRIYEVSLDGSYQIFAGTGSPGSQNGDISSASFNRPLGIDFSHSQDTLYIAESIGRLRRIVFSPLSQSSDSRSEKSGIEVFPNPASQSVTIKLSAAIASEADSITIIDSEGKLVQSVKVIQKRNLLDLEGLAPGVYFVKAKFREQSITRQLVVE